MLRFKRICISGASGTGKTTLANYIQEKYQISFLSGSSSVLWEEYGLENHSQVHHLSLVNPRAGLSLQKDILKIREISYNKMGPSYVTDRGPIDALSYYLNYFQISHSPEEKLKFLERVREHINYFDAFIFVKYTGTPIENNGKRVEDPFYQAVIDAIMEMVIRKNLLRIDKPMLTIDLWNLDQRKKMVDYFLVK